jgi:hypothetical protein
MEKQTPSTIINKNAFKSRKTPSNQQQRVRVRPTPISIVVYDNDGVQQCNDCTAFFLHDFAFL